MMGVTSWRIRPGASGRHFLRQRRQSDQVPDAPVAPFFGDASVPGQAVTPCQNHRHHTVSGDESEGTTFARSSRHGLVRRTAGNPAADLRARNMTVVKSGPYGLD